jgi:hypothetical protein
MGTGGYHGPPELTVARAFTEWTLDPWMLALVLILGGGYLAAVRRQPGWPVAHRIWFLIREDESDAARVDAELDARDARQAAARQAAVEVPAEGEQAAEKPWWEDDPRFTSRFKPT